MLTDEELDAIICRNVIAIGSGLDRVDANIWDVRAMLREAIAASQKWRPVAEFDAMQKKPSDALFLFEGTASSGRRSYTLPPTVQMSRAFGHRTCTHWLPYTAPPAQEADGA